VEAAIAVAQIVAAPVAAALLATDGAGGLAGWQTLFIVQGSVTVAFALVLHAYLPASLEAAPFLDADDKAWIRWQRELHLQQQQESSLYDGDCSKDIQLADAADSGVGRWRRDHAASLADALQLLPQQRLDSAAVVSERDEGGQQRFDQPLSAQPPLSAWRQVAETALNPRICYLVAIKIFKVSRSRWLLKPCGL
jgi:hypothetical protein